MHFTKPRTWTDSLERREQRKMVMTLAVWTVTSLHKPRSLDTVARELAKCRLDLVEVQEIGRDKRGTERPEEFFL